MTTKRRTSTVWSYPNIHGDFAATADNAGVTIGSTMTYDPYGQVLASLPDNSGHRVMTTHGWANTNVVLNMLVH